MNQPIPQRPKVPSESTTASARNQATYMALAVLLILGIALIALCALVMPSILGIVLVGFGFFFFIAFHYVVWGRWLSNRIAASNLESAADHDSPRSP